MLSPQPSILLALSCQSITDCDLKPSQSSQADFILKSDPQCNGKSQWPRPPYLTLHKVVFMQSWRVFISNEHQGVQQQTERLTTPASLTDFQKDSPLFKVQLFYTILATHANNIPPSLIKPKKVVFFFFFATALTTILNSNRYWSHQSLSHLLFSVILKAYSACFIAALPANTFILHFKEVVHVENIFFPHLD